MTSPIEHRCTEIRLAEAEGGKVIEGRALPYGSAARLPWGLEKAERGCVRYADHVFANLHHHRHQPLAKRAPGGGLEFDDQDDGLNFRLRLPATRDGEDCARLVQAGVLGGASIEFRALQERREAGVRVLEKILLTGVAIVDVPAYSDAVIEARRAALRRAESSPAPALYWW